MKKGDYFKDIQPLYTMIAQVTKIDGDRIYYKPLNFDDWNPKLDWFHKDSYRASHIIKLASRREALCDVDRPKALNIL
jgi:hypothetical protein